VRRYVKPPRSGVYWKLGGPLTSDHEAEAKAAERRRRPVGWAGCSGAGPSRRTVGV